MASDEREYTVVLTPYHVANLRSVLEAGLLPDSPLACFNSGDWFIEVLDYLLPRVEHAPNHAPTYYVHMSQGRYAEAYEADRVAGQQGGTGE